MSTEGESERAFKKIFEAIKQLEDVKINETTKGKSISNLLFENVRLKEKNIRMEKRVNALQARLERLSAHYQAIVAERDFRNIQERLMKSAPKLLEEENAALSDKIAKMEIKQFYVEEEKRKNKDRWRLHDQKMDRLVDVMGQLRYRMSGLEKRLMAMMGVCRRLRPAARLMTRRNTHLQLLYSHSRCTVKQLTARLEMERRDSAARRAQLAEALGSLRALETETSGYRTAVQEQRDETILYKKQVEELSSEIQRLEAKLEEHREIIRDQSDALSQLCIS